MKKKKILSVKELLALPRDDQAFAACYGTDFDRDAVKFVKLWSCWQQSPEDYDALITGPGFRDLFVKRLEPQITRAIRTGDATFLRKLADAIERHNAPLDNMRSIIATMAKNQKQAVRLEGGWQRTATEWCNMIKQHTGKPLDIVLFRRWATELGFKYKPDQRGRKSLASLKAKKAN